MIIDQLPPISSVLPSDEFAVENGTLTYKATKKQVSPLLYFTGQTVSAANNAQIMRIPSSGTNAQITPDTVVLDCVFAAPANITSNVSWQSYAGYITFTGTCTAGTTANVVLGLKGN